MRVQRHAIGSVRYDKRRRTWNYLWCDGPVRRSKRIGTKLQFPTKAAVWKEVERLGMQPSKPESGITVRSLIERYETERMPSRHTTVRVYSCFLRNHILPRWGDEPIQALQPRPVELWLRELPLSPKSKTHVRSLMHILLEYAMWSGMLDISRNPISLVRNSGATRKTRRTRSLSVEEFHVLLKELQEPFATMAVASVCLGLRVSETLALKWSDVDWLGSTLSIQRGIVNARVADVKTQGSARTFDLSAELLDRLKMWKQHSEFTEPENWIFASPYKIGRLPWSYTAVCRELRRAGAAAKIGHVSSHVFRHTFRSWLGAVGTSAEVQRKMMRHSDIRTTFDYGDVATDEMTKAGNKVARLAFQENCAQAERKSI
jgi:integrase